MCIFLTVPPLSDQYHAHVGLLQPASVNSSFGVREAPPCRVGSVLNLMIFEVLTVGDVEILIEWDDSLGVIP
ncbi:hypothetical protein TNCV_1288121 [Trichonephila clavipes]|nr:hypothetical protein TNCV_1288121 [Trichonephila clavipes]